MQSVKLMNRIDSKYLTTADQLPILFQKLQNNYKVQETNNLRLIPYRNLYYDTPDLQMYLAHHNKKLTRQKLRTRIYEATGEAFCEVKMKNNKKRTKKKRIAIEPDLWDKTLECNDIQTFVHPWLPYDLDTLRPTLQNAFQRITLVNKAGTERLTMDLNLEVYNWRTECSAQFPNLIIMELKQDGNYPSFFKQVLLEQRIKPYRISKYCIGIVLTDPEVKYNRFKKKIRYIERLMAPEKPIITLKH